MKRILSFLLSAVLLLTPMLAAAEGGVSSYYAGELTTTAISDSYAAGNQINLNAVFGLDYEESMQSEAVQALARLLSQCQLHMSFYDDFGTARLHGELSLDGLTLLSGDALVYEDGSVQAMTNLTGNLVLAIPAGETQMATQAEVRTMADYDFLNPDDVAAFHAIPASERLVITGSDMVSMLLNHLLGWVSYMQMDNDGEFYMFDDTYLEATETRDAVAQRMLGKIKADSFNTLLWNVAATIADTTGEFQLALAQVLAEAGVTRYQARVFADTLFAKETIDPMLDYVQPSFSIIENKDESPIQYDDVSYFFKKLYKCTQLLWDTSTDNVMTMDVSYDDAGAMVGFDATVPVFTTELPYEGDFTYSIRTDDNWQRRHTSHGELQIYNDQRVVGDLNMLFGQDVGGVKESYLTGHVDVANQKDGTSVGFGVDAGMDYEVTVENDVESETFEGGVVLNVRMNGEDMPMFSATTSGLTSVDADGFGMSATAALGVSGVGMLVSDVTLEQAEYEEITFAGGQAIDVTALDDTAIQTLQTEVVSQATRLGMSLLTKPQLLSDLTALMGALE